MVLQLISVSKYFEAAALIVTLSGKYILHFIAFDTGEIPKQKQMHLRAVLICAPYANHQSLG